MQQLQNRPKSSVSSPNSCSVGTFCTPHQERTQRGRSVPSKTRRYSAVSPRNLYARPVGAFAAGRRRYHAATAAGHRSTNGSVTATAANTAFAARPGTRRFRPERRGATGSVGRLRAGAIGPAPTETACVPDRRGMQADTRLRSALFDYSSASGQTNSFRGGVEGSISGEDRSLAAIKHASPSGIERATS